MNIVLIGYRGTGKTTTARLLARRLAWSFSDSDEQIAGRAGRSIAEIFADSGEKAFRRMEQDAIRDLLAEHRAVISLGGGAVMHEENRKRLAAASHVVWLTATPETIESRTGADPRTPGSRPNLTAEGGRNEIVRVRAERTPFYRQCATLTVDTEGKTPEQVADEIFTRLGLAPGDR
jgi:shikimate kinase